MPDFLDAVLGLEIATGLVWGLGAVLITLVVGLTKWRGFVAPAGELAAIAVLIAMPVTRAVPTPIWQGLIALIIAGSIAHIANRRWVGPLLAVPGAWLIASAVSSYEADWVLWFSAGAIVLVGWAAAEFSTRPVTSQWSPVMFSVFALGVFLAVPDTEQALVLLGALGPLVLLSIPVAGARLSVGGAYALIGVSVWAITLGGVGRPASLIGAIACVGLLAADPIARLLTRTRDTALDSLGSGWAVLIICSAAQLFVVLAISRTAGLVDSVAVASTVATFLLGAAVAAIAASKRGVMADQTGL